jgi:acetyl-CoA C-acetyltransferase
MKAITLAAQAIMLGHREIMMAGGMESMSNVPYYLEKARQGYSLGHGAITDGIIKDGLWDVYYNQHMGNCAEETAAKYGITREDQDAFAIGSYKKSSAAVKVFSFLSFLSFFSCLKIFTMHSFSRNERVVSLVERSCP